MKRLNLIPLALTTLMLGACSSEDGLNVGSGSSVAQGEKGYISFSLNLPTTSGVANRAANDNFGNGDEKEYAVNDAELLLFTGPNENDARFVGAYNLTVPMNSANTDGSNITVTSQKIVKQITNPTMNNGDKIYALVVVNGKTCGVVPEFTDGTGSWDLGNGTSKIAMTARSEKSVGTKYSDVATSKIVNNISVIANTSSTTGSFLMLNAPLYSLPGGTVSPAGGTLQTLTEIKPNNIFHTEAEAKANPAANVYVERAVAKVTVTDETKDATSTNSLITSYEINGWTLDVTNKTSYLVHQFDDSWVRLTAASTNYRFVGSAPVAANLYRTYWGTDPNYDYYETGTASSTDTDPKDLKANFVQLEKTTPTALNNTGSNNPGYCLENTFDVNNQNENQTTRVVIAATLKVYPDNAAADDKPATEEDQLGFYLLNGNKDVIYTKTKMTNEIKKAYLSNPKVVEALETTNLLQEGKSVDGNDLNVTFANKNNSNNEGGYLTVAKVEITSEAINDKFTPGTTIPDALNPNAEDKTAYDGIINTINSQYSIAYYKGGVAYYPVKIKHFGDDLTPWSEGNYGNNENKYLGRYGVLRNNWYNIQVNSIKNIGDPEVPEVFGNQDDPEQSWISVSINVLSWAKRSQEVDL